MQAAMATKTISKPVDQDASKTRHAPMWKVLIHNDDVTHMEFVVFILMRYFDKKAQDAFELMLEVHQKGIGLAGVYAKEQAEFKVEQVVPLARAQKFPLALTIEPAEK